MPIELILLITGIPLIVMIYVMYHCIRLYLFESDSIDAGLDEDDI